MPRPHPSAASHRSWIKSNRERLGLSLQALADRLRVSPQAVHQLEHSEAAGTISVGQLEKLARVMGCRFSYAFSGNGAAAKVAKPAPIRSHPARTARRAPAKAARSFTASPAAATPTTPVVASPAATSVDASAVWFSVTSD